MGQRYSYRLLGRLGGRKPEEEWVINLSYAWCRCTAHFLTSWGNEWWSTAYAWTGVSYD
ncbi:MAG: hypothetical protein NDF55_02265 [archaeon GB-1867-005]|nr:hypothetical protein [Candidatus Culexmicrobium cathedralense]